MMNRIKRKTPPIDYDGKRKAVWLQPTLIAEIEYRAWTRDGMLRQSSYKGLREVQDNAAIYDLGAGRDFPARAICTLPWPRIARPCAAVISSARRRLIMPELRAARYS